MRSLKTTVLVAMATLLVGCQSGKFRNPLAVATTESQFTAEELAAVQDTVEQRATTPVSFTNRLQSASAATAPRGYNSRRS